MDHSERTPSDREPLVLHHENLTGRVSSLFATMENDVELRRRFVEDPAGVISTQVKGIQMPTQQASETNQLLFAILANPALLSWLRGYAEQERSEPVSTDQFIKDFSRAVVERDDGNITLALLKNAASANSTLNLGVEPDALITHSPVIASRIAAPTDQRQDSRLAQDHRSTQNFEQSSHTTAPATTRSDARGNEEIFAQEELGMIVSPNYYRTTIDALVRHANELRASGSLGESMIEESGEDG